jgi:hypothetical protein
MAAFLAILAAENSGGDNGEWIEGFEDWFLSDQ